SAVACIQYNMAYLRGYTEVGTIRGELISTKQEARCLAEEIEQQREGLAEDEERLR
ncbi:hypothetical protein Pmar_PMAR007482, partial [Perkinsus marinus ATCC 50983]